MVKRSENDSGNVTTTYYLRSTVLEGKVLAELNAQGQKQKGYVFAGNQVLAEQQNGAVRGNMKTH